MCLSFLAAVLVSLVGCDPDLKPAIVAPDNAKSAGGADIGPNQHGAALKVAPISESDYASFVKPGDPALCSVVGGKATPGAAFADVQAKLATFTQARANSAPGAHAAAQGSTTKNSAQGSVKVGGTELVSGPLEGDPLNVLTALAFECAGDKPVLNVNGQARPVDVVYGEGRTTGAVLGLTSAQADIVVVLAGWNAATHELTVVRARANVPPDPKLAADVTEYKHWNAVVFRNLEGYVPVNAMPVTARSKPPGGNGNNDFIEVVFPMTGMAIKADALVVRAPLERGVGPSESLEFDAVLKKAK